MNQTTKKLLGNILKVCFALCLVYSLIQSGKLDFYQLRVIVHSWKNTLLTVFLWAFAILGLSSLRWKILLKGIGIETPLWRATQLTMIGLFFNSTIPGAVGGDIVKAVYVIRDVNAGRKTPAMLTILLDRIIGLMGLFVMGGVAILCNLSYFMHNKVLMPLAFLVLGVTAGTAAFFFVLFRGSSVLGRSLERVLSHENKVLSFFGKIYEALKVYKTQPFSLVKALVISIVIQTLIAMYFMYITFEMNGWVVDFSTFATIYPVGILLTALPLAPAGIGVGHMAFDKFYHLVGMENGANVFNVYILASIALNLTGFVPYMFIRKKVPLESTP